jgi:hypothetical protein
MKETLQKLMKQAYLDITDKLQDRKEFVMQSTHYGQIIATIMQIIWTQKSEDAINSYA